jgi:hypothetical protein
LREAAVNVTNGRPVGCGESAVDPAHHLVHIFLEVLILFDVGARRDCDLQEDDVLDVLRIFYEQQLERAKTVHQSFGVIQSIDAQDDSLVQIVHHSRSLLSHLNEPIERDSDGQSSDCNPTTFVIHQQVRAVYFAAELTMATIQEVQTIIFDVESYQVASCGAEDKNLQSFTF